MTYIYQDRGKQGNMALLISWTFEAGQNINCKLNKIYLSLHMEVNIMNVIFDENEEL